ncbi:hypothetical protein ABG067_007735, partial [Albugo candida]
MTMHSNIASGSAANVEGRMLVYGICQLYQCKILLFSTRSKPVAVYSAENILSRDSLPCFYILEHKDSYINNTTYYPLKCYKKPMKKDITEQHQVEHDQNDYFVAKKREEGEKKVTKEKHKLGKRLDDTIIRLVREEANEIYTTKWQNFLRRNTGRRNAEDAALIRYFRSTLSTKQMPTGVIPVVKGKIEQMLKNNEIEGMSAADIPQSAMWLHRKIATLKDNNKLSIDTLLNDFFSGNFELNDTNSTDAEEDSDEEEAENQSIIFCDITQDIDDYENDRLMSVGKTLKSVVNKNFDYNTLHERLNELQTSCHAAIYGLSKAIQILIDLLITGDIVTDSSNSGEFFRLADIDFGGHGIGKDDLDLFLPDKNFLQSFQEENLFSYNGFWNIMSRCVGKKSAEKCTDVVNAITHKLEEDDFCNFVTTPSLATACRQRNKAAQSLSQKMNVLFELLTKFQNSSQNKIHCIEKQVEVIFLGDNVLDYRRSFLKETEKEESDKDSMLRQIDSDEEDQEEEYTLVPTSTEILDVQDEEERDLTAKEINALIAVTSMMCNSSSIVGNVNHEYFKSQLYKDKQESIPQKAINFCTNVTNTLRNISLKENDQASFLTCYKIRYLRNSLVRFAGQRTKFRERVLYPVKEKTATPGISINHQTLYLLFCKEYNIFKENGVVFTSYHEIKSDSEKHNLFKNFFDWNNVESLLVKQNMTPRFSFVYNNQYDLNFLGKKAHSKKTENQQDLLKPSAINTASSQYQLTEPADKKEMEAEVMKISTSIKAQKKEYASLLKTISEEETERMNVGRAFRKTEKMKNVWDELLYKKLKEKRSDCNKIYNKLQVLNTSIKSEQSRMYLINKQLHNQRMPSKVTTDAFFLPQNTLENLKKNKVLIQGLDPGVVTTASFSCLT